MSIPGLEVFTNNSSLFTENSDDLERSYRTYEINSAKAATSILEGASPLTTEGNKPYPSNLQFVHLPVTIEARNTVYGEMLEALANEGTPKNYTLTDKSIQRFTSRGDNDTLEYSPGVKTLDCSGGELEDLALISNTLGRNNAVKYLNLSKNYISSLESLREPAFAGLEKLDASMNILGVLPSLDHLTNLEECNLSYNQSLCSLSIGESGLIDLGKFKLPQSLKKLNLAYTGLSADHTGNFASILNTIDGLAHIKELNLLGNDFSKISESIRIKDCEERDGIVIQDIYNLDKGFKLPDGLEVLNLGHTKIKSKDFKNLYNLKHLKELNLSYADISSVDHLQELINNLPKLQRLKIHLYPSNLDVQSSEEKGRPLYSPFILENREAIDRYLQEGVDLPEEIFSDLNDKKKIIKQLGLLRDLIKFSSKNKGKVEFKIKEELDRFDYHRVVKANGYIKE